MNLLSIETTSDACSVALRSGADVIERHAVEARRHSHILLPMIETLLGEAGIRPSGLDAVVLGNGPGSFIGMRIGASVAQGICYGAGIGIVPVSSLAGVAAEVMATDEAERVAVAQDARMGQVYIAAFAREDDGLPRPLAGEAIRDPGDLELPEGRYHAAGAAWRQYPDMLAQYRPAIERLSGIELPRARWLLPLGAAGFAAGRDIDPAQLEPAYLRVQVATVPG